MSEYCRDDFGLVEQADDDFKMWQGLVGPHYTPSVSEDGTLSWSNDGQLPNPEDVSIKGPPGEPGPPGAPGPGVPAGGTTGQLLAKSSDEDYDTEWIDQPEMDAGHVSYDSTEAYDDGTVGKELGTINSALTSLQSVTEIIDTASGAIASFPDGSGLPMRSLLATIEPQQSGTGDPSPENVRPISGWTGLSGWVEEEYDPTEQPTFTVTWQTEAGTVYGGTVDVVTGLLTADMGIKTELWKNFTSETAVGSTLIRRQVSIASAQGSFANKERTISNIAPFDATIARETVHVSMASSGNYLYAILPTTTDPDLEITFCYPLAQPQTYQLTPQQILTLLGNNTVFVDCGSVSVTYQASIKGYIDKVLAL